MVQLAFFYWDPKPEIFFLPVVHYPILWYGALFALGFILGFPIFASVVKRFFFQRPEFGKVDIKGECSHPRLTGRDVVKALNEWLYSQDPIGGKVASSIAVRRQQLEKLFSTGIISLKKQAMNIADRMTIYVVVATVLGARIGHLVFYENPSHYLKSPMEIFAVWKGGLSSHGAAVAIALALWVFSLRFRAQLRHLTFLGLLDFISVPTALAGACIRIGNFFNQEILGIATQVPWAVVFGHPADHSLPVPRHPVQLYEAFAYLTVFCVLWALSFRPKYLLERGRLFGLFLIAVFGFRIIIEYWKLEQSVLMPFTSELTMGQLLSFPAVLIGLWLYFRKLRFQLSSS
jgi:prolipoprotein diacylglyceryl transferase